MESMIQKKALLVELSISIWTGSVFDRRATRDLHRMAYAEDGAGRYHKSLIDKGAIKPIQRIANEARTYSYSHTLGFTDGMRLLPSAILFDYKSEMDRYRHRFDEAVDSFIGRYDGLRQDAARRLGNLYRPEEYPVAAVVRQKFGIMVNIYPVPTPPESWQGIELSMMDQVEEETERNVRAAIEIGTAELKHRIYDLVKHCAEKLSTPDAIFRDSLIDNIRDIVTLAPSLNIAGDELVNQAVEGLIPLLSYAPQSLRENTTIRSEAAQKADEIAAMMSVYMGGE